VEEQKADNEKKIIMLAIFKNKFKADNINSKKITIKE